MVIYLFISENIYLKPKCIAKVYRRGIHKLYLQANVCHFTGNGGKTNSNRPTAEAVNSGSSWGEAGTTLSSELAQHLSCHTAARREGCLTAEHQTG